VHVATVTTVVVVVVPAVMNLTPFQLLGMFQRISTGQLRIGSPDTWARKTIVQWDETREPCTVLLLSRAKTGPKTALAKPLGACAKDGPLYFYSVYSYSYSAMDVDGICIVHRRPTHRVVAPIRPLAKAHHPMSSVLWYTLNSSECHRHR
jgi:hypothetical protein